MRFLKSVFSVCVVSLLLSSIGCAPMNKTEESKSTTATTTTTSDSSEPSATSQPAASSQPSTTSQPAETSSLESKYGAPLTITDVTPIASAALAPASFDGKAILVEAKIASVCKKKGCWMMLAAGDQQVRVRFKDYGFLCHSIATVAPRVSRA